MAKEKEARTRRDELATRITDIADDARVAGAWHDCRADARRAVKAGSMSTR